MQEGRRETRGIRVNKYCRRCNGCQLASSLIASWQSSCRRPPESNVNTPPFAGAPAEAAGRESTASAGQQKSGETHLQYSLLYHAHEAKRCAKDQLFVAAGFLLHESRDMALQGGCRETMICSPRRLIAPYNGASVYDHVRVEIECDTVRGTLESKHVK